MDLSEFNDGFVGVNAFDIYDSKLFLNSGLGFDELNSRRRRLRTGELGVLMFDIKYGEKCNCPLRPSDVLCGEEIWEEVLSLVPYSITGHCTVDDFFEYLIKSTFITNVIIILELTVAAGLNIELDPWDEYCCSWDP